MSNDQDTEQPDDGKAEAPNPWRAVPFDWAAALHELDEFATGLYKRTGMTLQELADLHRAVDHVERGQQNLERIALLPDWP